jgi:hypothetical protein
MVPYTYKPEEVFEGRAGTLARVTAQACWYDIRKGMVSTSRQRDQVILCEMLVVLVAVCTSVLKRFEHFFPLPHREVVDRGVGLSRSSPRCVNPVLFPMLGSIVYPVIWIINVVLLLVETNCGGVLFTALAGRVAHQVWVSRSPTAQPLTKRLTVGSTARVQVLQFTCFALGSQTSTPLSILVELIKRFFNSAFRALFLLHPATPDEPMRYVGGSGWLSQSEYRESIRPRLMTRGLLQVKYGQALTEKAVERYGQELVAPRPISPATSAISQCFSQISTDSRSFEGLLPPFSEDCGGVR